jgi:hypothetical protein
MKFRIWAKVFRSVGIISLILFATISAANIALAQNAAGQSGTVRGQASDPSGAAVPNATVTVNAADGATVATATTGRDGGYEAKGVPAGSYTVNATATGFQAYTSNAVIVTDGQISKVDIHLAIQVQQQQIEVTDNAVALSVDPGSNAGAVVLSGKDLDALSDDPDQLQSDLEALAGPSVGPNGGQMYIDGFTAGQLPPKSSIREIRINQNPFSAEYDKLGFGRIEIFTKPGTDQLHGQFFVLGNDSAFNSRSPYLGTAPLPGYYTVQYNGSVGGPLSKKASFFVNVERRNINDVEVVNAQVLNPDLSINPTFTQAVPNPRTRTNVGPRLDYQLTPTNTLSVRYQYYRDSVDNDGVGQFQLASQGYHLLTTEHTLQLTDTQVFGSAIVNETHFQYLHDAQTQSTLDGSPTIIVPAAFTGGGNNLGAIRDTQNHYELQNYTSILKGKNYLKFGFRLRAATDTNSSTANFNGTFQFQSLAAYQGAQLALAAGQAVPVADYPLQFSVTTGSPLASVHPIDAGLYIQNDFKWRPNLTLSTGLRFETQNYISNHADFAPRLAIAWGIGHGKTAVPKTVLRVGWGMFYDRFTSPLVLQALRQNGITQQQYIVSNPNFYPNVPCQNVATQAACFSTLGLAQTTAPAIYQISPTLHAPYTMETVVSIERQVSKAMNATVTYVNGRGVHELLTNNINAPEINGIPQADGVRPLGVDENIYQYQSEGIFKQNQFIANFNVRGGPNLSLNGYYSLNFANSDTSGSGSFPSNPFNISQDYGRAGFDVRHRAFVGGTVVLPFAIRLNPFVVFSSGSPFNVTTGTDLNGDSIFNDRPAFANTNTCPLLQNLGNGNVCTQLGTFNTLPAPGQKVIPINAYTGPSQFSFNLRIARTFGFGSKKEAATDAGNGGGQGGRGGLGRGPGGPGGGGPGGGRGGAGGGPGGFGGGRGAASSSSRYSLTFSVNARNLFNFVNPSNPAGSLNSTRFDTSNALAGGAFGNASAVRLIQLQAQFNF